MMPSSNNFPFRRTTDPFLVPATDTPSQVEIGSYLIGTKGLTSFAMVNSYPIWMRLKGSGTVRLNTGTMTGAFDPVAEGQGWLIPPGPFFGVFTTQYPVWVSCIAVARPGFPIKDGGGALLYPSAVLEMSYGGGA